MVVEAAGGVVWRRTAKGRVKVLLVHRPRYDDWTLPKGKLEPDETAEAAALREVEEETGYHCELGARLPTVEYVDQRGRDKRVRYWAMQVLDGEFETNAEVDQIEWLTIERAAERLTFEHDVRVLAALAGALIAVS